MLIGQICSLHFKYRRLESVHSNVGRTLHPIPFSVSIGILCRLSLWTLLLLQAQRGQASAEAAASGGTHAQSPGEVTGSREENREAPAHMPQHDHKACYALLKEGVPNPVYWPAFLGGLIHNTPNLGSTFPHCK